MRAAVRHRPTETGDNVGISGKGAIPDHVMRARMPQIEHRGGGHIETGCGAIEPDERAGQPCGALARFGVGRETRPIASAEGWASQCGGRSRATLPPSWSTIRTAFPGSTRRSAATSSRSCGGSWMLRANRITPAGG